ncbi:MAG: hypothetical protein AAFN30_13960 [Actinomycetota bacterium]
MWIDRLRLVLRLNALTSFLGGALAVIAAPWVSETLGIDHVTATRLVGVGLIGFALHVGWTSTRSERRLLAETRLISAGDAAWVLATVVVVALGLLTTWGVVVAAAVGLAVADFGLAQWWLRAKALAPGVAPAAAV